MKNRALTVFIRRLTLGASLSLVALPLLAADPAPPQINAKAYILLDYDSGRVLAEGNADERLDPASLTKIMASYVIGQALKSGKIAPGDMVVVGKDAWATGNPLLRGSSLMFLKPGDRVPVAELNRGVVIQSGNDASIALADHVAGSQDAFVNLMNQYVGAWGLKNTHFRTVHGLDSEGQYSSARDMALISQRLIADVPDEYQLNKEKEFTFNKIRQINRNRLLWDSSLNVDGVKTGFTGGAGHNLVASATDGPMRLISVVLGAPTDRVRFDESKKLLTWGFRFYETVTPIKVGQPFTTQKVWYGERSEVPLGVDKSAAVTIPRGQMKDLKASYTLTQSPLEAPLKKGQAVGTIDFQLNGKTIEQRPLVVLEDVPEAGFFGRIIDFIMLKLHGLFGGWFG
ncbi:MULTISPECIES: serine hydrolase [Edwardsiella]|nr:MULTISPECIES: serine hydrolase [Edwardsiella]AKM47465.1 D-alanyl-D-alanine carboxypeptidase [Edwardsiella sp. EA181011]ELM3656999.1 serine hydrolase [Edwardsiella piscicida]AKR79424.1 serine hydrolase [Edwardsiella sp. LADL05-105]KAB0593357.1 serine-type D-Ala-D-Ala carboxypeptidase [Edwardsiella anguillarum]RFT02349.1 serine-type D-Ala-D-Ala carboxypeptidase [Edwardsiella anguillarum]